MQGTKDKLHKFIDDGVRQTLEDKLVVLTSLLSERGICLTSQEKNCIVDLDYDDSCYVDQSSTWSNEENDENESDEDNDGNNKSKVPHVYDRIVVCNEDGFLNDIKYSQSFCPNKKAFKRCCLEEIAKL